MRVPSAPDADVLAVAAQLRPLAGHVPLAIHEAKILVLAPEKTGRLDIMAADVDPEEKAYVGKRIEINFLAAAGLPRGKALGRPLDTVIADRDVDVKTSLHGNAMIAPKNIGQIIMLILHNPKRDIWSLGVIRALPEYMRPSQTRDRKSSLSAAAKEDIVWIRRDEPMPVIYRNPLASLPEAQINAILAERSGQARLNSLFSVCLDTPIPRWLVVALGQQLDPAKRVRDARVKLEPRGIRILSSRYDRAELEALGLNPPESSAFFYSTRRSQDEWPS